MQVAALVSKNLLNPPKKSLSTRTRIIHHHTRHVIVPTPKRQITNRQPNNDGHEHSAVKRHDRQHNHVPDCRVDSKKARSLPAAPPRTFLRRRRAWRRAAGHGSARRTRISGKTRRPHPQVLEVLVEGRDEEAGEQREGVARPRVGFPRVEEERDLPAPVEGHLHHLLRFVERVSESLEREGRSSGFLGRFWRRRLAKHG